LLCKTNYAQVEVDTVYLFPDTTTFLNETFIYVGDVGNAAVRFNVPDNWESYKIDKLLVLVPDSTVQGLNDFTYTISIGSEPLDSILFESGWITVQNYFPVWWEINVEPDIQLSQTDNFFISGGIPMWICISYNLDSLIMNQFLLRSMPELRWSEGVHGYYALKAVVKNTTTGINDEAHSGFGFNLFQNYPNPFNPETFIRYELKRLVFVILKLYDLTGKEVITLVNEKQTAGRYQVVWNGRNKYGKEVSSGIYFYRLKTDAFSQTRKMILIR